MTDSRQLWTRLAVFALVGVLLGALAAFVVRDRSSSDPGLDSATPAASHSANMSDPPTPPQTTSPEPTQQPTDVPKAPTDQPSTSVTAFGKHVGGAIKEGAALLESLQNDAKAFDIESVQRDAAALSDWAAAESAWLDAHPPAACYAEVHREYASAVADFGEAAGVTLRFAKAFPFADFDELQQAIDLANRGAVSMQDAGRLIQQVHC